MAEQYGEYEVESFLGKGSIGKVYLARHRRIGRRVALKTVHLEHRFEDEEDRIEFYKRLQREAELCASMQHPNIVTLYEAGYDGDQVSYLATEYVDGESLLARLKRTRPLPIDEALSIAADLLRGLAYAHSKGIIHRDIKPANLLLTSTGQAKIADFGVARPLQSSLTATRSLVGTPNYMSPEQVKTTPVSTRSDLFSAGVVMYEMLTGLKPFAAPELSGILYNVVNLIAPSVTEVNESVPEEVASVVTKLLAKRPEDRYANAEEALAGIEAVRTARSRATGMETIAVADTTTPLPTIVERTEVSMLRRPVPAIVFWVITLTLAAALLASIAMLRTNIARQKPVGVITPAQAQEARSKIVALTNARELASAGKYDEALRAYDDYLARYPHSSAARSEREAVDAERVSAMPKAEVTRVAKKPRGSGQDGSEDDAKKRASRWDRFKKWFRGK